MRPLAPRVSASYSAAAPQSVPDDLFSVAPMMDYTDRHFRYLLRLVSKRATLYTEMVRFQNLSIQCKYRNFVSMETFFKYIHFMRRDFLINSCLDEYFPES
jgi:hypothetical protein